MTRRPHLRAANIEPIQLLALLTTALFATFLAAGPALADSGRAQFGDFLSDYEAIRLALVDDSMVGVEQHARSLAQRAGDELRRLGDGAAESSNNDLDDHESMLKEIERGASVLASAQDFPAARDTLFELTKQMVLFRKLAGDESTVVAYCSMAAKAWIQASGQLGNPYMGQSMPQCGEVVSD